MNWFQETVIADRLHGHCIDSYGVHSRWMQTGRIMHQALSSDPTHCMASVPSNRWLFCRMPPSMSSILQGKDQVQNVLALALSQL